MTMLIFVNAHKIVFNNLNYFILLYVIDVNDKVRSNDDDLLERNLSNGVNDDSEGFTLEKFHDESFSGDDFSGDDDFSQF